MKRHADEQNEPEWGNDELACRTTKTTNWRRSADEDADKKDKIDDRIEELEKTISDPEGSW